MSKARRTTSLGVQNLLRKEDSAILFSEKRQRSCADVWSHVVQDNSGQFVIQNGVITDSESLWTMKRSIEKKCFVELPIEINICGP